MQRSISTRATMLWQQLTLARIALVLLFPTAAIAEEPALVKVNPAAAATEATETRTIGMVTGSRTGTYYRFGYDIKEAIKSEGLDIEVKESTGSIDNIHRISSKENAALGIVQSDVLGFLMRSKEGESRKLAENLRMVFPFYSEEIHVLANKSITKFEDLEGKSVVVGPKGSGIWLTSLNLFNIAGVEPAKMLRLTPEEGMVAVLSGKADAMIYVGGKPVKLFQNMEDLTKQANYAQMLKNVHLLPMNDPKMLKEYGASTITSKDYNFVTESVPTLTVSSVLVSFGFLKSDTAYAKARCDDIRNFSNALLKHLEELKRNGHPKWSEVDLDAEVGFWRKDNCAIGGNINSGASTLENELLETLRAPH